MQKTTLVTPFVGVWIETGGNRFCWFVGFVTPFVGVWIETVSVTVINLLIMCHTLRGCVDWNRKIALAATSLDCHTLRGCVDWNLIALTTSRCSASHTLRGCVDWNWIKLMATLAQCTSHPSWVCGLKHNGEGGSGDGDGSHPSWVCGLKHNLLGIILINFGSHTLRGCVDWNILHLLLPCPCWVTPFVGVWIETYPQNHKVNEPASHTLRGCVDWNRLQLPSPGILLVTPFVGVWIETVPRNFLWSVFSVTPFVGVWIETPGSPHPACAGGVTPFVGVWIETYNGKKYGVTIAGHTLRGCVDWNSKATIMKQAKIGHTLRGCVDWNWLHSNIISMHI